MTVVRREVVPGIPTITDEQAKILRKRKNGSSEMEVKMATEVRELRIKARKAGAKNVMEMSKDELEDYIAEHSSKKNGKRGKAMATKAVKAAKKRGRPKGSKNKVRRAEVEEETPRKRGRPKGSKNKVAVEAPKRRGRPPKAEATSKSSRNSKRGVGRPVGSGSGTRVSLKDRINWNKNFDFREGSTQDYILQVIRKVSKKYDDTADIREEVFDRLVDKINKLDELTFYNRETGKPHKGEKAEDRLKYYIARTMFDYAVNTNQHEPGGSGGTKKRGRPAKNETVKRGRGRPRKVQEDYDEDDDDDDDEEEEERPRKRGRPKGSKNKVSNNGKVKRGPGRPRKDETRRGPGRPKGSKNKVKAEEAPRRGRPPGSKNKVSHNRVSNKTKREVKRGPGRPKGSKNKNRVRA